MATARQRAMPAYLAMGAAALLVVGGAYTCSTKHNADDRLSDTQAGASAGSTTSATSVANDAGSTSRTAGVNPARRCASGPSYALLKRELFRRAAQVRGRDDAQFERIAEAASLRVERPVVTSRDEGLGSIACGASASIDLPPGLAVAGGRTSLVADLGYTLQPAADGTGDVIALSNADAITIPLATLGRSAAATPAAPTAPPAMPVDPAPMRQPASPPPPPAVPVQRAPPPVPVVPAPVTAANPSFPCSRARSRGEIAICGDPGLAALDRRMAAQYRSAVAAADPRRREVLRLTGRRFYGFRDVCPTNSCIANGYRQRMAEIDDIMQPGPDDR